MQPFFKNTREKVKPEPYTFFKNAREKLHFMLIFKHSREQIPYPFFKNAREKIKRGLWPFAKIHGKVMFVNSR